jgi:hypothetical protein
MAQPSATIQVFSIPELCGLLFEHLSHEDIYRLQNLTKGCRVHLRSYKPWQKCIFHQDAITSYTVTPVLAGPGKLVDWIFTSGPQYGNSVLTIDVDERAPAMNTHYSTASNGQFGLGANLSRSTPSSDSSYSRTCHMQNVKLNWLLLSRFPKFSYYPLSNMLGLEVQISVAEYFINPDASYRPLLLTNPPLSELTVIDYKGKVYDVANSKGVTMGDIVDALLESRPPAG